MQYIHKIKLKNLNLENNVFLAPMAGVTDKAFRIICKEFGPGLVFTEMASAKAIYYNDKKTKQLLDIEKEKKPIGIQIFGSDITSIISATQYVDKLADIIDINMGCPAPKVVKNGDGSKLLLNLNLIGEIVENVVKNTNKPVSVKIRKGWDSKNLVAVEAAKIIEKAGASMITVHGRTREEYYSGTVDLEIIKKVKNAVNIPVIGNGDIKNKIDAKKMFEYTGVDGIMIGRGALGNPWIFEQIINMNNKNEKDREITNEERLEIIKKHIQLEVQNKNEVTAIREMRKHICWYLKNLKDSTKIRNKINKIEKEQELIDCLTEYFNII